MRTTQPGTRPTYTYAAPRTAGANSAINRGAFRGSNNFRDRGFRDLRFRGYYNSFFPFYGFGLPYCYNYFDPYDYYNPYGCYGSGYSYGPGYYGDDSQYGPPPDQYMNQPDQPGDQDAYATPPNGAPGPDQYAPPSQPARETPDFVLVRKDGGLLFANGYIVHGGQMSYTTKDGGVYKVMLSDLDLDATRKWNDERGNSITLPN